MSTIAARPNLLPEEFEEIARLAARADEGLRLEFIDGKLGVKAVPDGDHDEIILWLQRLCMRHRPDLGLYSERGLKIQAYRQGRARPDATLAPPGSFAGQGEWADTVPVLMVAEVTSCEADAGYRDRVGKLPRAYAETGIPVYLLIDRHTHEVIVYSEPDGVRYERAQTVPFGKQILLPDPVRIMLDTEPLKDWVR